MVGHAESAGMRSPVSSPRGIPGQGPLGGVTERRGAEETVLPWELSRLPRGWMVVQPVREARALVRAPHFMERGWWHDAEGDR